MFDSPPAASYHSHSRFVLYSDKDAMGDLGERLRREREAKGIALDEIAQKTRIGVRMLKAIEAEAFDQLPGGIFNKSFIEQYARCLGLDEKQAIRDYLRATAAARETQYPQPASPSRPTGSIPSQAIRRIFVGAAAIVVIVLVVWSMIPPSEPPADSRITEVEPPAASAPETVALLSDTKPATDPSGQTATVASMGTAAAPETRSSEYASSQEAAMPRQVATEPPSAAALLMADADHEPMAGELPEELLLQINAHSTVWISITADGEREWQGTLKPNQSRRVQAAETIRLTVGNAGGVELTLNGKDLGALGREGEVKTVTLAARALQEVGP